MLSGLIPDNIGGLRNARVLNFCKFETNSYNFHFADSQYYTHKWHHKDNNNFEKTIPTTMGLMTQLKELVLGKKVDIHLIEF